MTVHRHKLMYHVVMCHETYLIGHSLLMRSLRNQIQLHMNTHFPPLSLTIMKVDKYERTCYKKPHGNAHLEITWSLW